MYVHIYVHTYTCTYTRLDPEEELAYDCPKRDLHIHKETYESDVFDTQGYTLKQNWRIMAPKETYIYRKRRIKVMYLTHRARQGTRIGDSDEML